MNHPLRMTPQNQVLSSQVQLLTKAVQRLTNQGVQVLEASVGKRWPIITVMRPGKRIKGEAHRISCREAGKLTQQMVARYGGCLIQWQEDRA